MTNTLNGGAEVIRAEIKASEHARDTIHDVMVEHVPIADMPGDLGIPDAAVIAVIDSMTENELLEAARWGIDDTVVRDTIFTRLEENGLPQAALDAIKEQKDAYRSVSP